MLHYISKDRFEKACLGKEPDKVIRKELNSIWPYYEIPEENCWVLYIEELYISLVFGSNDISEDDLVFTFSDWKLNKISEKPDPQYILNLMKKCCNLNYEFGKVCETGIWELINSRTGERIEFSIKKSKSYFDSVGIGYPEKLDVPFDKKKIYIKDKFIETLCNGLRNNNN